MLTMYGLENKITISRNGNELELIKDAHVYEVYYKSVYLGYFNETNLNEAIQKITETGFYDGRDYDLRIQKVDEGRTV